MRSLTKLLLSAALLTCCSYSFAKSHLAVKADSLETVSVSHHLSAFRNLHIQGPFDVYITQGDDESIKFDAPVEVKDRIVADVSGNTLEIRNKHDNWGSGEESWYSDKSWWHHHPKIKVYVVAKNIDNIKVSGSGSAVFEGGITTDELKLLVRGSGEISGKVEVKNLESHMSGSGHIKLSGTATTSNISVAGSGNFMASELVTSNSAVRVSGSGDAKINASDKITAAVSGSGNVNYTGSAKKLTSTTSGSGSISRF
jgi:Putative auto-transporter adhesin, head GIN domain